MNHYITELTSIGVHQIHQIYRTSIHRRSQCCTSCTSRTTSYGYILPHTIEYSFTDPSSLDLLVQGFLYHVNYFYYVVYPPQFLDDYAEWWAHRKEGQKLSPAFTCLLVRACAYSAQFLQQGARHVIETELGKSAQVLSEQFHEAADKLSFCFKPGTGGLMQVQQLFISACWYKSESKFRDSWHALASAIREAQEIGLHKDVLAKRCSPFEFEMRRRTWCLLYVWDLQLSTWLNRPLLIDQKSSTIEAPNLRIDTFDNVPSPFLPISLQYDMCIRLYNMSDTAKQDFRLVLQEMEDWLTSFPPVFSFTNPDTSRDLDWPHLLLQREYLHCVAHMFLIGPLKPCLTKTVLSETELAYRPKAVDMCLRTLATAQRLFDLIIADSAKAFIVTCAAFEPSALLTSAIIHDKFGTLPRRQEVLAAINTALMMLSKIATQTNTGSVAYGILTRLTASISIRGEPSQFKRQRMTSTSEKSTTSSSSQVTDSSAGSPFQVDGFSTGQLQELQAGFDFYPTVSDFENANFRGLEDLWDWHILNLNVLGDGNAPASFGPLHEINAM